MKLAVLEVATPENLSEEAYLEANLDVKHAGVSARDHFIQYGAAEGRRQFSSEYMLNLETYRNVSGGLDPALSGGGARGR